MFGVDQFGRDTLSRQFSHSGSKASKIIRPGSSIDMEIQALSNYTFLSSDLECRKVVARKVLYELFLSDVIPLPESYIPNAIKEIIGLKMDDFKRMRDAARLERDVITSRTAIMHGDSLFSRMLEDSAFEAFSEKKEEARLKGVYEKGHPEVIELALYEAYTSHVFLGFQSIITEKMDLEFKVKALEMAEKSTMEQATVASRSGVQRVISF